MIKKLFIEQNSIILILPVNICAANKNKILLLRLINAKKNYRL